MSAHPSNVPLSSEAAAWLEESLQAAGDEEQLLRRWSAAGRKLGAAAEEGRGRLLAAALGRLPADRHLPVVEELDRTAAVSEKVALLRALPRLPDPARFAAIAVDAVRSNATAIVAAIALDNPFPARHFTEEAFNQMVVKCLFVGLPLARVEGLAARRTPELRRMVAALVSERRAAGRPVPDDAALVLEGGS